jgi:spore germination protein GerM
VKTRRVSRPTLALCALGLLVATAGCGVAIQTSAQQIAVPRDLFHTPSLPELPHHGRPVDVYFLTRGHLVASTRYVPASRLSIDQLLQDTLNELTLGPTTSEFRSGISTAMSEYPRAALILTGNVQHGVASVDLDSTFGLLDPTELFEADGQIVYTLTQFPVVTSVNFLFDGVRQAYLQRGQVRYNASVGRPDYRAVAPLAS